MQMKELVVYKLLITKQNTRNKQYPPVMREDSSFGYQKCELFNPIPREQRASFQFQIRIFSP